MILSLVIHIKNTKSSRRPIYRYITCGIVNPDDPINIYRLIAGNKIADSGDCIRVRIPDDMKLTKWSCDSYSGTTDTRTLNELGYDVLVKINGKWIVRNDLKGIQPHAIYEVMDKEGLHPFEDLGYATSERGYAYLQQKYFPK